MSSNKTVIPGMEDAFVEQTNFTNPMQQQGTYVPNPFGTVSQPVVNQKPIVGFLYSISKSNSGEYWPLRIGSNMIGRSADADICLNEATVSEQHAVLVIRQMKNPEKIIASICDSRSTCGTMINGESLGFDPRECFNGDILTIGDHYDLYFILIDAKQIGLNVCRDFINTQEKVAQSHISNVNPYAAPNVSHGTQGYGPQNIAHPTQGYAPNNLGADGQGTIGFNEPPTENRPATKPGGTIFM